MPGDRPPPGLGGDVFPPIGGGGVVYPPLPPGGWVPQGPPPGPPPGMGGGMFPQPGPGGAVVGGSGGSRPGMDGTGTILDEDKIIQSGAAATPKVLRVA